MSQEVANVKKFVSGIKSKPLTQPKNKKKKKAAPGKGSGRSSEDKVTGYGRDKDIVDGEVIEPRIAGAIEKEPEIYDAEIVPNEIGGSRKALTREQRQITSGAKAIEAPRSRQFDGL
jgi:hypothetical protein